MKLITFVHNDKPRIGAVINDTQFVDLAQAATSLGYNDDNIFDNMLSLIDSGETGLGLARQCIKPPPPKSVYNLTDVELLAPLPRPRQLRDFVGFELHMKQAIISSIRYSSILKGGGKFKQSLKLMLAKMAGMSGVPSVWYERPIYYKGNRYSVTGPDKLIKWPTYSKAMDYECEIACVIGKGGKNIARDNASDHIFGFMIFNDLTARDTQTMEMAGHMGPAKSKDFDNASPMGPYLVTADEIDDVYDLDMVVRINSKEVSRGSSSSMYWKFEDMISHTSRDETLVPGEIMGSGTVGNGCGFEHLKFLSDGDCVEIEISKLGTLRTTILAPHQSS